MDFWRLVKSDFDVVDVLDKNIVEKRLFSVEDIRWIEALKKFFSRKKWQGNFKLDTLSFPFFIDPHLKIYILGAKDFFVKNMEN